MNRRLPLLIASPVVVLGLALFSSPTMGDNVAMPASCPDAGEKQYELNCCRCHGRDAEGGKTSWIGARVPVPTLRGLTRQPDADWEELIDYIEEGHRAMPGWSGVINRPNIRRIVEYLDSLDHPESYPSVSEDGPSAEPAECDTTEPSDQAVPAAAPITVEEPES